MAGSERVVFALCPSGETRKASILTDCRHPVSPSCEDLVRIRLVPDIPNQPIVGGAEKRVERDRQLDHS